MNLREIRRDWKFLTNVCSGRDVSQKFLVLTNLAEIRVPSNMMLPNICINPCKIIEYCVAENF